MEELITRIDQMAGTGLAFVGNMTVLIITVIIGLLIGLFGLKLARVWAAFVGFLIGTAAGGGIVQVAGLSGMASVGVLLGTAVLFAILACVFYKIGIFFFVIFIVTGLCAFITQTTSLPVLGISLVLGIVAAVVSVKLFDPVVIIVTAISGGVSAGNAIVTMIGMEDSAAAVIALPLVLAILCAAVQFIMRSKQLGKKQAEKADEKKQQISRESEVELARSLLEDDFEDVPSDMQGESELGADLEEDDDFRIIE